MQPVVERELPPGAWRRYHRLVRVGLPSSRLAIVLLTGALAMGASISAQTYLAMLDHGHEFWRILAWQCASWSFWGAAGPLAFRAGAWLSAAGRISWHRWATLAGVGGGLLTVHALFVAALAVALQPYQPVDVYEFGGALSDLSRPQVVSSLLVYLLLLALGHTTAVSDRAGRAEVRQSKLEAELTRAQLESLRLEIQPHFLFNTLNSIAALIRLKSNDKALEMLIGLGDLMRSTLERAPVQEATLGDEVEFVRRYLELQRARFADRVEVRYAVSSECLSVPVPAFVLQPLVENAFRHGVAKKPGRSVLEVGAALERGTLRVWVVDEGAGLPRGFDVARHTGTGLSNIRVRLERLYGEGATLTIAPRVPGEPMHGTRVEITLPAGPGARVRQESA